MVAVCGALAQTCSINNDFNCRSHNDSLFHLVQFDLIWFTLMCITLMLQTLQIKWNDSNMKFQNNSIQCNMNNSECNTDSEDMDVNNMDSEGNDTDDDNDDDSGLGCSHDPNNSLDFPLHKMKKAEEDMNQMMIKAAALAAPFAAKPWKRHVHRERVNWVEHVKELHEMNPDEFTSKHRMPLHSFNRLCRTLHPQCLHEDEKQSCNRTGLDECLIATESMLCVTLRWFGGGECHDIEDFAGTSKTSFHHTVHRVCDAIDQAPELQFNVPKTERQQSEVAAGFAAISTFEAMNGCVGCVDGLLLNVITPSAKQTETGAPPKAHCSGHCRRCGVNVQGK